MNAAGAAWAQRVDAEQTLTAIASWNAAAELNPKNSTALSNVSRAYYYYADCFLRNDDDKAEEYKNTHDLGVKAAERALVAQSPAFAQKMREGARIEEAVDTLSASAVPALYWRSSNLGRWAGIDGFATLLSYKDEIRAVMQFCLDNDPTYFYQGPDRYFGIFFARAPGFAGGDMNKSRDHFEIAMAAHPNYLSTKTLYAEEWALKEVDRDLFEELLTYNVNADPNAIPDAAPENICEQRKSKKLLAEADELF